MGISGKKKGEISFRDVEMGLFVDILYLINEELNSGVSRRNLIAFLKPKGYGKHKVLNTLEAMVDARFLFKKKSKIKGGYERIYATTPGADNFIYVFKHFHWGEVTPTFREIRKKTAMEQSKNQDVGGYDD